LTLDAHFAVHRKPRAATRIALRIDGALYPLTQVRQQDIPRFHPLNDVEGYPAYWCALGEDWIQVYPPPPEDVEVVLT
jgi:hypothetical protein